MQVHERPPPEYWPPPSRPGPGGPDAQPPKRKLGWRARAIVACVAALAFVVAGLGIGALVATVTRSSYPAAWDPRVAGLARFVERERGLDFDHPVLVDFLSVADYKKRMGPDGGETSADDRADLVGWASQLRALGLASGDLDLTEVFSDLASEGTLAFYSDASERVTVRGTGMTPAMRVTLVHELTHAVQDQHFDLGRDFGTDGADSAFRALVEGDAVRIENRYVDSLSEEDATAYWDETDAQTDDASDGLASVPAIFRVLFGAPYALGEPYVGVVMRSGGQRALDRAFRNPPRSELALLDPSTWLDGEKLEDVAPPGLERGEKETDSTDLGALILYTMLASRIDPVEALAAVDGWDGDALVAFERSGTSCVRFAVAGVDAAGAGRLHDALEAWAATLEPQTPTVTLDSRIVSVLACDPGTKVVRAADPDQVEMALAIPVTRSQVMAGMLDSGFDAVQSRCIGEGVVTTFPIEQLADPEGTFAESTGFQQTMERIVGDCTEGHVGGRSGGTQAQTRA